MKKKYAIIYLLLIISLGLHSQKFKEAIPKDIALVPIQNQFRNSIDLSGIWKFKVDSLNEGIQKEWYNGVTECRQIAVPGSWNEQYTDLRDYLNWCWYEKDFYIPASWQGEDIYIRINDATYFAKVWVNGKAVGQHEGCHVPFAFKLNEYLQWGKENKISIQVENIQSPSRVPTGAVEGSSFGNYPNANYDFFPYSGLNRNVVLYSLPAKGHIKDITVRPDINNTTGILNVEVEKNGSIQSGKVIVKGHGQQIAKDIRFSNHYATTSIQIPEAKLWSPDSPNLYEVEVVLEEKGANVDKYSLKTGVRIVSVDEKHIYLNGEEIFLNGFGKHIDFPVIGRGTADPVMVKDFELMKWTGANSFRTTHYPYDEGFYDMADQHGFMVIAETPSVGLIMGGDSLQLAERQRVCKQYLHEVIYRDKNHPSVIMWCVANEPNDKAQLGMAGPTSKATKERAYSLFKEHFDLTKELDPTRLVIYVGPMMGPRYWFELTDVIAINRYWGWYTSPGSIENGSSVLSSELDRLHRKHKKPCMVTEFGCDTYAGMHAEEPEMFTEEYQVDFIKAYLDVAESKDYVVGMHIWNFADFKTSQSIIRLGGYNLKGVFTRERKPKMAAHYLRERWFNNKGNKK
ncbi:beta-glucuronidase [Plebeiibacterium marinum]|uniref:Beta-glucuronidase n=1 Tax=Plebeiibacterium marinum TaxID=2992111 RepID=A0AAE3SLE0_9BACT|nr:beta-glucuronidase [Plebeiobacterium marinum]MCW3807354.1 beta-glucuronidase [Plebeiobacterium marinum]